MLKGFRKALPAIALSLALISAPISSSAATVKPVGPELSQIASASLSNDFAKSAAIKKKNFYSNLWIGSRSLKIKEGGWYQYGFSMDKHIKTLNVQEYNSKKKKWYTVKKLKAKKYNKSSNYFQWKLTYPKNFKTTSYRLQYPSTKYYNQYLSQSVKVSYVKSNSSINSSWSIDNTNLSTKTSDKATVWVQRAPSTKVSIQYYNKKSKKWVSGPSVRTSNTVKMQKVMVPYPKASAGYKSLRVYVSGTARIKSVSGKSKTVKYTNPNTYKGTQKAAYNHMKKWCPGVTVTTKKLKKNILGTAEWPKHHVNITYNLKGLKLQDTSIHECGHILQLKAFNEDTNALKKARK